MQVLFSPQRNNKMKLIMENWKRFLNEQRPPVDPRLLPALAQDAMEVVAAKPGIDAASITLATMAEAGSDLPLIDMESVAEITLGELFDEAGLQSIRQGAAEFAADQAPPPGGGQWASPDISDEDTLEERGLGLGKPPTSPPEPEDDDLHYDNERPPPPDWVNGRPPKPPAKEGKVSGHRSEVTYSKEKRGKSKKPEKKAYNKADRAQAKRELKK